MIDNMHETASSRGVSRRSFLGAGSAALATAALSESAEALGSKAMRGPIFSKARLQSLLPLREALEGLWQLDWHRGEQGSPA